MLAGPPCSQAVLPGRDTVALPAWGRGSVGFNGPAPSRSSYDTHGAVVLIACQRAGPGARRTRRLARWMAREDSFVRHRDARKSRRDVAGVAGVTGGRELTAGSYGTVVCRGRSGVFRHPSIIDFAATRCGRVESEEQDAGTRRKTG